MAEIVLDFQVIETRNPQLLMVGDTSKWAYAEDLPSWLLITRPGSKKPLTFSFKKESMNVFNSHNLGLTCLQGDCEEELYEDLPDGIYKLCLKSNFENVELIKYYLKTDRFDVDLAKVIVKNGFEYTIEDKQFRDKIYDIKWLSDTAKSHALLGDFDKSDKFFTLAVSRLRDLEDCKNCN